MTRFTRGVFAASLACFLCAPLSAQTNPESYPKRLERIKTDIAREKAIIMPLLPRLRELIAKYESEPDLEALVKERKALRGEIETALAHLHESSDEFKSFRSSYNMQQTIYMLGKLRRQESAQDNFKGLLDNAHVSDILAKDFKDDVAQALSHDETAYRLAVKAREKRRRDKHIAVGLSGLAVLAALGLFFLRGRAEPAPPRTAAAPQEAHIPLPAAGGRPKTPPKPDAVVGRTLDGRFRVDKLLRESGMGPVYAATDAQGGGQTILKCVLEDFHRTTNDLDRFFARSKELAAFKHATLAETRAVFLVENRIYIASERVSGRPLSSLISPGNAIELRSIKLIVSQLALMLDTAHGRRLIHGGIAPSNLIVREDGSVKVLDLGIGAEARRMAARLSLSREIGAPAYLAPEQELGSEFKQSDIYSMGALCYAMLTGRPPFPGPDYLAQKQARRYTPASALSDKSPVEADPVIHKALEAEPQHRYQNAMDFFDDLDAVPEYPA